MQDYHIHTKLCRHATGDIVDYAEAAVAKGFAEIGFSEHIPIPNLNDPTGRMKIQDFDTYLADIETARKQFPQLNIKFGLEADYIPQYMPFIRSFVDSYPFDYVIGSVHFVDEWDFSNTSLIDTMKTYGVKRLFTTYYTRVQEAAETGLYDIFGHLDLPKLIAEPPFDITALIKSSLQAIRGRDMALDINTSGWRKGLDSLYPEPEIIESAFDLGIPVVLGSDAHRPSDIGYDFSRAVKLLQSIGYTGSCSYSGRIRSLVPFHQDNANDCS